MIKTSNIPSTPRSKYRTKGEGISYNPSSSYSGAGSGIDKLMNLKDVTIVEAKSRDTLLWDEETFYWSNGKLTKADVGLSNVDNLSRVDILDDATLTGNTEIASSYTVFTGDVLEVANTTTFYSPTYFEDAITATDIEANNFTCSSGWVTFGASLRLGGLNINLLNNKWTTDFSLYGTHDVVGISYLEADEALIDDIGCNNITVKGALNCFELVAYKVRSTNG